MSNPVNENQKRRFNFLLKLYQKRDRTRIKNYMFKIGRELGYSNETTKEIVEYHKDKRYLKHTASGGGIEITVDGMDFIEEQLPDSQEVKNVVSNRDCVLRELYQERESHRGVDMWELGRRLSFPNEATTLDVVLYLQEKGLISRNFSNIKITTSGIDHVERPSLQPRDIPAEAHSDRVSGAFAIQEKTIAERLKEREGQTLEKKSSFRYDTKLKQSNPKVLEKTIAKTIAAFMNSKDGGVLFIGIDDEGNVLGLQDDYKTLKRQNSDGFEIELRQSLEKYTKDKRVNENIEVKFHRISGKEICEVITSPASRPVVVYDEGGRQQEFYVRIGNSSKPYNLNEFYEYSKGRFG